MKKAKHLFVISTMEYAESELRKGKLVARHHRTPGIFLDLKNAQTAIIENACGIQDCSYNYAVIEEIQEGIYPFPIKEYWFKWSRKERKYKPCNKPAALRNIICFGIG